MGALTSTTISEKGKNVYFTEIPSSRDEAPNFELLFDSIALYWKPAKIEIEGMVLDPINQFQGKSHSGFTYEY